ELGLKPLAKIKAYASAGVDPKYMGMGPVPASKRCLQRAGWTPQDLDLMEINEAFAAQAIAVNRQMGWDTSKVNVNGGAIALGHPIGASGARILVTLLHEMQKRGAKKGLGRQPACPPARCLRDRRHGRHRQRNLPAPRRGRAHGRGRLPAGLREE